MSMILLTSDYCPFCMRCALTLNAKGVAFEARPVDLTRKAGFVSELSPYGRVPVLRHDGHAIYESSVICEYIEEVHPEPRLMPRDPGGRAGARFWIDFCNTRFMPAYFNLLKSGDEPKREVLRGQLMDHLAVINSQGLAGTGPVAPYWLGADISLVDFAFYPFFERFADVEEFRGIVIPESLDRLHAWLEAVRKHPAVSPLLRPRAHYVNYFRGFYAD